MSNRKGDWMTTYSGRQFWPLDPRADEVAIEDIAHALSLICRFGGHCKEFYSVAQHCCLVANITALVEPKYVLHALLHDAAEAYIGDIVRPMKRHIHGYKEIEHNVMSAIMQRFELLHMPDVIKLHDDTALMNEHRDIIQDGRVWDVDRIQGPTFDVVPVSSEQAEHDFLRKFTIHYN